MDENLINRVKVYHIDYNQNYEENIGTTDPRGIRGPRGARGTVPPKLSKLLNIILVPILRSTPQNILKDYTFCWNRYDGKNVYSYMKKNVMLYNFTEPHIWKNNVTHCAIYNNVSFKNILLMHGDMEHAIYKAKGIIDNKLTSLEQDIMPIYNKIEEISNNGVYQPEQNSVSSYGISICVIL